MKANIKKSTSKIGNLPVYSVNPDGETEYIINSRGAKVYMDESKQPRLKLKEGSITKTVLSVGFSKSHLPIATIQEKSENVCYILPTEYLEWCQTCVGFAMRGINMFPSNVVFTKCKDKYFVDIL